MTTFMEFYANSLLPNNNDSNYPKEYPTKDNISNWSETDIIFYNYGNCSSFTNPKFMNFNYGDICYGQIFSPNFEIFFCTNSIWLKACFGLGVIRIYDIENKIVFEIRSSFFDSHAAKKNNLSSFNGLEEFSEKNKFLIEFDGSFCSLREKNICDIIKF